MNLQQLFVRPQSSTTHSSVSIVLCQQGNSIISILVAAYPPISRSLANFAQNILNSVVCWASLQSYKITIIVITASTQIVDTTHYRTAKLIAFSVLFTCAHVYLAVRQACTRLLSTNKTHCEICNNYSMYIWKIQLKIVAPSHSGDNVNSKINNFKSIHEYTAVNRQGLNI